MLSLTKFVRRFSQFVPLHEPPSQVDLENFSNFLTHYYNIVVLTGAGISTESGIPDYRSEGVGMYNRTNYKPMDYSTFLNSEEARIRYWTRNYIGWPTLYNKKPNHTHFFLTYYQSFTNKIKAIVTQNVDGLHSKAGNINVVELHGNAFWVECLKCGLCIWRPTFQDILSDLNPNMQVRGNYSIRPDGDVEVDEKVYATFKVPNCEKCGGILKPSMVFFGDNVPLARVKKVENLIENSEALLVMGTSLSTLSSSRIVDQAFKLNKFICIINIGPTKCDTKADLLIDCKCSDIFPNVAPK